MEEMSVRQGERTEGILQVLSACEDLSRYTITICKKDKVFPKANRWILTKDIVESSVKAYGCIRRANALNPNDGQLEKDERRFLQDEAYSYLEQLISLVQLSFGLTNLDAKTCETWTEKVINTEKLLKAWKKSDKERFK